MRRLLCRFAVAFFVVASSSLGDSQGKSANVPLFVINGPTVIAFFRPVSDADLQKDPDLNESLSDFQYYSGKAGADFKKKGIEYHEVYTLSFSVRVGSSVSVFRSHKDGVGYYFIVPGKRPHVEHGVMTNDDLMQVADSYFNPPKRM